MRTMFTILALLAGPVLGGPPIPHQDHQHGQRETAKECYTNNCTGGDITSKRKCYLCCGEHCAGTNNSGCQDECDSVWFRLISEGRVTVPRGGFTVWAGDWAAQNAALSSDELMAWASDDGVTGTDLVNLIDGYLLNPADDTIARFALVTLSWAITENPATPEARALTADILFAELEGNPAFILRAGALTALAETGIWFETPQNTLRTLRAIRDDPDPAMRRQALQLLSRR